MQARVRVGAGGPIVPTIDLKFSDEVGGSGTLNFEALYSDLSSSGALDPAAVLYLELQTAPSTWVAVAVYVLQYPLRRKKVGVGTVACLAVSVPEAWGRVTVFYPEYATSEMVQGAGTERGLGWMNTAYDWAGDPRGHWGWAYEASRTAKPTNPPWPTGCPAKWVNAGTNPDGFGGGIRKLFRKEVTVTGTGVQVLRLYASSDENLTVWFAAEKVLQYSIIEWGRENTYTVDLAVYPGTYAVCMDTVVHVTKGGDGQDDVMLAIAKLNDDGSPSSWVSYTNDSWAATRRGETDTPPGPTPGGIIQDIVGEAVLRGTAGWSTVTYGFTGTVDSYGVPWAVSTERLVRYGFDDYAQFFNALGETEADIWMAPGMVLHAAPRQGQVRGYTWTETQIQSMSDSLEDDIGTAIMGLTHDGWVWGTIGGWRREGALEIGQALSTNLGRAVIQAAFREHGRWDASFTYVPGQVPFFDFNVGDWVNILYRDINLQVRVLSIAGTKDKNGGGILWSIEVTNEPV
jgi:hypothetical protein